jgi:hypothetical protein
MAKISKKQVDAFDRHLDGVYGHFKTKDSFKLDYLLSSIRTEKLGLLETASDILDLEIIEFEELVQRDIDYVRVHQEIVDKYLKLGANRVVFFPPLIVTLIGIDHGRPIENYSNVESEIKGEEFVTTYDKNRFEVRLNLSDEETVHTLTFRGKLLYYFNYAVTLKYNSDKVRLVVLDGQHRLMALKKMMDGPSRELVSGIDVPICVFFAPDARSNNKTDESLVADMRELFVRINEEAKKVSGHFIWLLKDKSLAATAVRCLGDKWKRLDGPTSFLHQLEWNQREYKLASQTTRPYTITTVSIIAEALQQFIFRGSQDNNNGYTYTLLKLSEIDKQLSKQAESLVPQSITEDRFDADQLDLLKGQIEKYVTPSLDILFRLPSPYKLLRNAFVEAVKKLDMDVAAGKLGAAQFKNSVLCKFRTTNELDQEPVKGMEEIFNGFFHHESLDEIEFFRRNVFQQGVIRAWAKLFFALKGSKGLTPASVAEGLVNAMEVICFEKKKQYFSFYREYTQNVIYRGAKISVNESSKHSLRQLILATFANDLVRKAFLRRLPVRPKEKKTIEDALHKIGFEAASDYLTTFQQKAIHHLKRNWKFHDLNLEDEQYLQERVDSKEADKIRQFQARIGDIAEAITDKAKSILANVIGIKASGLSVSVLGEEENDSDAETI